MKITIISYHTCPLSAQEGKETGGMNIYVRNLASQLAKKGHTVDVFTRNQDKTSQPVVQVEKNFRVIHIDAGPLKAIPGKKLGDFIPDFVKGMKNFLTRDHTVSGENIYDILDCHYYLSGLIGLEIQSLFKKNMPLFITFHTLGLMKNLVAKTEEEKALPQRIHAEMRLVKAATRIISTGETDAKYLEYLYACPKKKISVITPGVDTKHFAPMNKQKAKEYIKINEKNKLILFVGRIEPLKGIDVLLYAMKILLERQIRCCICLWVVGGDVSQRIELWADELKKLEEVRKLLDITAEVKFVGRKNPEELPYYYNAADIVVMPSQYESFGMSALEAMACGTPVITTDVTGISEILDEKHQSLITSANDPLQLAEKMEKLLTDSTLATRLSNEVYEKVQDCSWEKVAEKISEEFTKQI